MSNRLSVIVDQQPLAAEPAREVWERFSAYMEQHRGDFDGFAKVEGFLSARVAANNGVATLILSSVALNASPAPTRPHKPSKKRAQQAAATADGASPAPKRKRRRRRRGGGARGPSPQPTQGSAPAGAKPARPANVRKPKPRPASPAGGKTAKRDPPADNN